MDIEKLVELKEWLSGDCVDDPEELFEEIETIIELIDFYLNAIDSEIDKKPFIEFNISDLVYIKINKHGEEIRERNTNAVNNANPNFKIKHKPLEKDKDGWSKEQLWCLMQEFGDDIFLGCNPPFDTVIRIPIKKDK